MKTIRIVFVHLFVLMFKEELDGFAVALVQAPEVGK